MASLINRIFGTPAKDSKNDSNPTSQEPVKETKDFHKAPSKEDLFAKVDPTIDGQECLHDCASCTVRYPSKFEVDMTDSLYGNVDGWATHLLVATGKTDWVRDVADEGGSLMEAIAKGGIEPDNGVCIQSTLLKKKIMIYDIDL